MKGHSNALGGDEGLGFSGGGGLHRLMSGCWVRDAVGIQLCVSYEAVLMKQGISVLLHYFTPPDAYNIFKTPRLI